MSYSKKKTFGLHSLLILCILIISLPVILALIISTQSEAQVMSYPPGLIPGTNMISNYTTAWNSVNLGRMIFNSTFISFGVIAGKVSMSLLAAFAFTHFEFKGKNLLFGLILVTLLLPVPVRIVALFDVIRSMGWINTYAGLMIPFWASATSIFILIQRFKVVPSELIDASKDGRLSAHAVFFQSSAAPDEKYDRSSCCNQFYIYLEPVSLASHGNQQ